MKLYTPKHLATIQAAIEFADGTDENGNIKCLSYAVVNGRLESSNSIAYTQDGRKVSLSAKLFIFEQTHLFSLKTEGKCKIGDTEFLIANVTIRMNPDGSVNHVVLGLI